MVRKFGEHIFLYESMYIICMYVCGYIYVSHTKTVAFFCGKYYEFNVAYLCISLVSRTTSHTNVYIKETG